jgi:hypothetical protein
MATLRSRDLQVCLGNRCDSTLPLKQRRLGLVELVGPSKWPSYSTNPMLERSAKLLEASGACRRSLISGQANASDYQTGSERHSRRRAALEAPLDDLKPTRYSRHARLDVRKPTM